MTHGADAFVAELKRWREVRGLSQASLAREMGYDRSYVSKVESGGERPSEDFAARADEALQAGGGLRRAYREIERAVPAHHPRARLVERDTGSSLVVEHDDAELTYDGRRYRATMRRKLRNEGAEPIVHYLVRISVDRFPGSPEQSNELYRNDPLTWEELHLQAWQDGEPITWSVRHDRDAFKELWLLFENEQARFPLYPGESTELRYTYTRQ